MSTAESVMRAPPDIVPETQSRAKYRVVLTGLPGHRATATFDNFPPSHVLSNFCPAGPSNMRIDEDTRPAAGGPMKYRTLKIVVFFLLLSSFALAQDVASFEKRITVK